MREALATQTDRSPAGRQPGRTPFAWWGPVWAPQPAWTLIDLLRHDVLPFPVAAWVWSWVARRRSLVVAAGPRGAGKTTLLTALLAGLPPGATRYYLRGCYEPFTFLDDPLVDPQRTMLLINELSPHLPAYLWGPGVARALGAVDRGFAIAATIHAGSVTELVGLLTGYPLRVPATTVAALGLVIVLRPPTTPGGLNQITQVTRLDPSPPHGVRVTPVWDRADGGGPALAALGDLTPAVTALELERRERHLRRCAAFPGPVSPIVGASLEALVP